MSAKREKLRRMQERIWGKVREMCAFEAWLEEEPSVIRWRKWHRWKKRRPEIRK